MTEQAQRLIGLQRAEFDAASTLQNRILYVQIAISLVAIVLVFLHSDTLVYFVGLVPVALAITWLVFAQRLRKRRGCAERARRVTSLMDAFGEDLPNYEYTNLLAKFAVPKSTAKGAEDHNYFASSAAPGYKRLRDVLEEVSFWSHFLLEKSEERYWHFLLGAGALLAILLFGLVAVTSQDHFEIAAKVVLAAITPIVSVDLCGAALAYSSAAQEVQNVLSHLEQMSASEEASIQNVMILFSDYNSAVEGCPMFAPGLYEKYKDELNDLWSTRKAFESKL